MEAVDEASPGIFRVRRVDQQALTLQSQDRDQAGDERPLDPVPLQLTQQLGGQLSSSSAAVDEVTCGIEEPKDGC